ncbi:hypothetical protein BJ138DRAFT_282522 [Hygrophoropsis aurantiaca]|uniref:Uncharacterized protein n=1 Tax=Hygrophoropsis aurantiaca TaxID=72124 RepID=A0ACB8A8E3_9AGAM|nr:hypothetical protein BJ138DRAFT_282522 [Hygrophoropsis aurantiaca]
MSEFRDFREAPRDIRIDSTYARPPSNFYDYSHQRQSHVPPIPQPSYDTTFGDAEYMIVDTNEGQAWDWQADIPLHDPGSQKNPAMGMVRGLVSGLRRFSKVVSTTQEHLARNSIFHRDPQANRRTFPRYQPERQDSGSKYVEEFVSGLKRLPRMASKARLKVRKSRRQGTFDSSHNSSIMMLHRDRPSLPRLRVANPDAGTPDSPRPILSPTEIASLRDMISPIPSPHLIPLPPSPTISMDSDDEHVHVQESITPRSSPGNQSNARLEPTFSASLPRTRFALPLVSEDSDESEYMNVDSRLPIPIPDYHARRFSPPSPHYYPSSRPYVTVDPSRPPIPLPNPILDYARFSPRPSHSSSSNHSHATVDPLLALSPPPQSTFGQIRHFFRQVNRLPWVSSHVTVRYIPGSSSRGRSGPGRRYGMRAVTSWYGNHDPPRALATSLSFSSDQPVHHPSQPAIQNPIPTPISPMSRTDTPEVVDRPRSPRSWIAKEPNATLISPPSMSSQKFMTRYIEKDDDSRSHEQSRPASDNSVYEIFREI